MQRNQLTCVCLCVLFRYWPGGYASGFSHVDHTVKPRLIHVKGKHCPRMREVSEVVFVICYMLSVTFTQFCHQRVGINEATPRPSLGSQVVEQKGFFITDALATVGFGNTHQSNGISVVKLCCNSYSSLHSEIMQTIISTY